MIGKLVLNTVELVSDKHNCWEASLSRAPLLSRGLTVPPGNQCPLNIFQRRCAGDHMQIFHSFPAVQGPALEGQMLDFMGISTRSAVACFDAGRWLTMEMWDGLGLNQWCTEDGIFHGISIYHDFTEYIYICILYIYSWTMWLAGESHLALGNWEIVATFVCEGWVHPV